MPPGKGYERYVQPRWRQVLRSRAGQPAGSPPVGAIARGWRSTAPVPRGRGQPLRLEAVECNLCGPSVVEAVAVGEDFEYWTSPDSFLAVRCTSCGLVFLDPRPAAAESDRIYPDDYHAFDFSPERFGLVHRLRQRFETRRLLAWAAGAPKDAVVMDVGCGDGFHLDLLRRFGPPGWRLVGVDPDERAVLVARGRGLDVHQSFLDEAPIDAGSVDLALLIQTIEHVADPVALLTEIGRRLRPGGRLLVVTDNVGSPDFAIFGSRHWGGWHFPRHWHLYDRDTLAATARRAGLEVVTIDTMVSPVNWVYSVRNALVDWRAPRWSYRWLSLEGAVGLGLGTVVDAAAKAAGRGALLRATFARPATGD